ncbi:GNAT family N-acetyltransferase [Cohnella endophytica]|uniref:GNAT family N-acetyltransferase n=1 Tax=Cohnella endophytica TaxID=2419778 RepID=A0A494X8Y0_9BACL|nr:GNAT family N-acetyltransferase [Cohnella endophytica]RKP44103.1 GNAT family N-acetyltransferase [Cohnella endophytica]
MNNEELPILTLTPMTEQDGQAICDWRYPPPYELFKWPTWAWMVENDREFADPDLRREQFLSTRIRNTGELVGYVQLFPMDRTLRIGMGLHPEYCDRGLGTILTKLVVEEAQRRRPEAEVDLEVEQWNTRAIRVYEKSGFAKTDSYTRKATHGTVSLFVMVWREE